MIKILENKIMKWIGLERFLSIQIDITNFCNLACSHCYHPHHKNENAISLANWIDILDEYESILDRLNAKGHIIICGGEPLTSQYLKPILENLLIRKRVFHLSILTNGTLVRKIDLSLFKKFPHVDFQVSFDGPNENLHDSFRGKGNFKKALLGVQVLKENGFAVILQATLTKNNSYYIRDFFELAKKIEADKMSFTRLITVGNGLNLVNQNNDQSLKPLELKKSFEEIIFHSAKAMIKTDTDIPLMNLIHPSLGKKQRFHEGIVIDYQGNLLVSSRSRSIIGSVLNRNLSNLFFNHEIRKKLKNNKIENCSSCPFFENCGGDRNVSFGEYGSFFRKDPGCWININSIVA